MEDEWTRQTSVGQLMRFTYLDHAEGMAFMSSSLNQLSRIGSSFFDLVRYWTAMPSRRVSVFRR